MKHRAYRFLAFQALGAPGHRPWPWWLQHNGSPHGGYPAWPEHVAFEKVLTQSISIYIHILSYLHKPQPLVGCKGSVLAVSPRCTLGNFDLVLDASAHESAGRKGSLQKMSVVCACLTISLSSWPKMFRPWRPHDPDISWYLSSRLKAIHCWEQPLFYKGGMWGAPYLCMQLSNAPLT